MVSPTEMKLVKESLPRFEKCGYDVAVELYREVFKGDSRLRNLFSLEFLVPKNSPNAAPTRCPFQGEDSLELPLSMQARILAQTIVAMASKIDNLSAVDSAIERICHKHVSRDIRAEHYGVVAAAFDTAMRTVLKDDLSADEFAAWNSAIGALAKVFIERETAIRESAAAKTGGWVGFRKFFVGEQVEMGNAGAKLLLVPVDKGTVCPPGKGQFSCLRMNVEQFGTIYHNTFLSSQSSPTKAVESDYQPRNKDPSVDANRLALSAMAPQRKSSSSRLAPSSNSGASNTRIGNPAYGTVISTAAARAQPIDVDPKTMELLVTPGRVISQHATEGAVVELSVPVGGYSNPGMSEAKGGTQKGNSLLRNALDKSGSKLSGSPLLRQAGHSTAPRMKGPMNAPGLKSPMNAPGLKSPMNAPGLNSPMSESGPKSPMKGLLPMASSSLSTNRSPLVVTAAASNNASKKAPIASMGLLKNKADMQGECVKTIERPGSKDSDAKSAVHRTFREKDVNLCSLKETSAETEKSTLRTEESDLSPTNVMQKKLS